MKQKLIASYVEEDKVFSISNELGQEVIEIPLTEKRKDNTVALRRPGRIKFLAKEMLDKCDDIDDYEIDWSQCEGFEFSPPEPEPFILVDEDGVIHDENFNPLNTSDMKQDENRAESSPKPQVNRGKKIRKVAYNVVDKATLPADIVTINTLDGARAVTNGALDIVEGIYSGFIGGVKWGIKGKSTNLNSEMERVRERPRDLRNQLFNYAKNKVESAQDKSEDVSEQVKNALDQAMKQMGFYKQAEFESNQQ